MKKVLILTVAAGCCVSSMATDARVITMGRHDAFFMDEASVFRNPANINIYPNMVYGSYGYYSQDSITSNGSNTNVRYNRDPVDPFFGAIISYSLNQGTDGGTQYPMLSLGGFFNRYDKMLDYVTKGKSLYLGKNLKSTEHLYDPKGKIDLLLGYTFEKGGMIGIGGYLATQKVKSDGIEYETSLMKGTLGMNWPISKSTDLEVDINGGTITAIAEDINTGKPNTLAEGDYFGTIEARLFSALSALNGDFVPHIKIDVLELDRNSTFKIDLAAGLGLNLNIDKGFFWAGGEFLYGQMDSSNTAAEEYVGGRMSFGIERNILRDWFVIRVGGQKEFKYISEGTEDGRFEENNPSDASDNDLVSLGFGINIENRLKIDWVAAEDIAYTFTNLFSGLQHHLFTRVSATYSF
jgi:hypothetical protein